jgi:GTPase SAR1 family protein
MISVVGLGAIGKTALVNEFVRRLTSDPKDAPAQRLATRSFYNFGTRLQMIPGDSNSSSVAEVHQRRDGATGRVGGERQGYARRYDVQR